MGWSGTTRAKRNIVLGLLIGAITGATFLFSVFGQFVFDDSVYLVQNAAVKGGLTASAVRWALTSTYAGFWHPVTWLSHLADVELYGLSPLGHHVTNVLLHTFSSVLLFAVLNAMTGTAWPSVVVALLFGIHPLRVESVAWIAERKDLLSGFFWIATMGAYLRYTKAPSWGRYGAVAGLFVLGLLSKPMLVTLPFALLLLDYWPLGRISGASRPTTHVGHRPSLALILSEKLPLVVFSLAVIALSLGAQRAFGALTVSGAYPVAYRIGNAILSYGMYLRKVVWPTEFSAFYPHPGMNLAWGGVMVSAGVILACTWATLAAVRRAPHLFVAWFWFLGTLVPVIGIVQLGTTGMADHYTYIPLIGVFVGISWGVARLAAKLPRRGAVLAVVVACLVGVLVPLTIAQERHWKDDVSLFSHAVLLDPRNTLAHYNLGVALALRGDLREAELHFRNALDVDSNHHQARVNLGQVLATQGRMQEAAALFAIAAQSRPDDPIARYNLAKAYSSLGDQRSAAAQYEEALRLNPRFSEAHNNLGVILREYGRTAEARQHFAEAVRLNPGDEMAKSNLSDALRAGGSEAGRPRRAVSED